MIRTFHPVGQGAFYSECHSNFNIVYDCGTMSPKRARTVVEDAFRDKVVDVLFISHFDKDHISSIPDLKKSTKQIRVVVIPLLDNQQRNLLINFMHDLSAELKQLIMNPRAFFGSNTKVIEVRPASGFME
ncbi:MAG: MBL fold metallo-hydrolase, partial [Psychrobacter sp.]|nr:MBL fold metallo-hydrolase [Psychrobacter sp.]